MQYKAGLIVHYTPYQGSIYDTVWESGTSQTYSLFFIRSLPKLIESSLTCNITDVKNNMYNQIAIFHFKICHVTMKLHCILLAVLFSLYWNNHYSSSWETPISFRRALRYCYCLRYGHCCIAGNRVVFWFCCFDDFCRNGFHKASNNFSFAEFWLSWNLM